MIGPTGFVLRRCCCFRNDDESPCDGIPSLTTKLQTGAKKRQHSHTYEQYGPAIMDGRENVRDGIDGWRINYAGSRLTLGNHPLLVN